MRGHLFVFCNRAHNRLKILYWEEGGCWLLHKRLERGRVAWPDADTPALQLSATELRVLLGGLDFRDAKRQPRTARILKPPKPPAAFAS